MQFKAIAILKGATHTEFSQDECEEEEPGFKDSG